ISIFARVLDFGISSMRVVMSILDFGTNMSVLMSYEYILFWYLKSTLIHLQKSSNIPMSIFIRMPNFGTIYMRMLMSIMDFEFDRQMWATWYTSWLMQFVLLVFVSGPYGLYFSHIQSSDYTIVIKKIILFYHFQKFKFSKILSQKITFFGFFTWLKMDLRSAHFNKLQVPPKRWNSIIYISVLFSGTCQLFDLVFFCVFFTGDVKLNAFTVLKFDHSLIIHMKKPITPIVDGHIKNLLHLVHDHTRNRVSGASDRKPIRGRLMGRLFRLLVECSRGGMNDGIILIVISYILPELYDDESQHMLGMQHKNIYATIVIPRFVQTKHANFYLSSREIRFMICLDHFSKDCFERLFHLDENCALTAMTTFTPYKKMQNRTSSTSYSATSSGKASGSSNSIIKISN
ncbi:Hypothetical predicted protein, partial [Paramuricea clavata]